MYCENCQNGSVLVQCFNVSQSELHPIQTGRKTTASNLELGKRSKFENGLFIALCSKYVYHSVYQCTMVIFSRPSRSTLIHEAGPEYENRALRSPLHSVLTLFTMIRPDFQIELNFFTGN